MKSALASTLFAACCVSGCVYVSGTDTRQSFAADDVRRIELGKTTKRQILDWFGPPAAIARQGQGGRIIPGLKVQADTFLEIFAARHTLNESDIVYYYRNISLEMQGGAVVFAVHTSRSMQQQELWILIDDTTGTVRDHVTKGVDAK